MRCPHPLSLLVVVLVSGCAGCPRPPWVADPDGGADAGTASASGSSHQAGSSASGAASATSTPASSGASGQSSSAAAVSSSWAATSHALASSSLAASSAGLSAWTSSSASAASASSAASSAAALPSSAGPSSSSVTTASSLPGGFTPAPAGWSVPAAQYASTAGFSSSGVWSLLDLDGDGRPDLVRTSADSTSATALPGPRWDVYVNTGSAFAGTALSWSVPWAEAFAASWSGAAGSWSTLDVDGDGRADLVRTSGSDAGPALGGPGSWRWDVYVNQGSGFAPGAVAWAVPGPEYALVAGATSTAAWTLVDLHADGLPDLVRTSDGFSTVSALGPGPGWHWDVYRNTGSAFAATAAAWGVPGAGYFLPSWVEAGSTWATLDLDGDRRPDLVHTGTGTPARAVDGTHWEVFTNTGTRFAVSASAWPVPTDRYFLPAYSSPNGVWAVLDLNDDGRPELLRTSDSATGAAALGAAPGHWDVFANTGGAFAPAARAWAVPDLHFFATAGANASGAWQVLDLDGDRLPELVETAASSSSTAFGAAGAWYWRVHRTAP